MIKLNAKTAKASLLGLTGILFLLSSATPTLASEVKYKQRLSITLSDGSVVYSYGGDNQVFREWAVVKIKDNKTFSVYHTTQRSRGMLQRWFDHPVKAMKICLTDGFDLSNCQVVNSDTATIPEGHTIHDLSIEIKYSEKGNDTRSRFNIPTDAKPE